MSTLSTTVNTAVAKLPTQQSESHCAINTCLNKFLLCNVGCQTHHSLAFAMNDACSCHNRMSHSITILVLRHFGLLQTVAKVLFITLQQSIHHISTGCGPFSPRLQRSSCPTDGHRSGERPWPDSLGTHQHHPPQHDGLGQTRHTPLLGCL